MTGEVMEAQDWIVMNLNSRHKAIDTHGKDLGLGIDWV